MSMLVEKGIVLENGILSQDVRYMIIEAPQIVDLAQPGQFVMVKNEHGGTFLRRPFGIADIDEEQGYLLLIYRVAGKGTKELANLEPSMEISVEGPLGGGFKFDEDEEAAAGKTLLIGGGVGVAPLIYTASHLAELEPDNKPIFLLGVRSEEELFWLDYLDEYVDDVIITTNDGSAGKKGFAIDAMPEILAKYDIKHIKICGPTIMMEGLAKLALEKGIECQVSLEKRMACGIGVCLGCTFEGKVSGKRWKICHDGPVFPAEEVF